MEVRDGRSLDDDVRRSQMIEDLLAHFYGGADLNRLHTGRWCKSYRAGNQKYSGTASRCRFRQRVAHLAAGTVGYVADGVKRFLSRTGCDQDGFTFEVAPALGFLNRGGDLFGIG